MEERGTQPDTIVFLGTGGARFMVINQFLASGGIWLNLAGTEVLLDPGPGSIVQATKRKLRPEKLEAIIVSHRHLDHAADVNIMVEAMTDGGLRKRGRLFAPGDALAPEPVVFSYLRKYLDGVETLREGGSYSVGNIEVTTPVRHIHAVETYGMVFRAGKYTVSYIPDTRYFEALEKSYTGELLIMNIAFLRPRDPNSGSLPSDHLSVPDAERLVKAIKPKAAIMTHFGMTMWRAKPWEIAETLTQETGVKVMAARDGMRFALSQLDAL